ncbi:DNAI1 [Acanthosepion pharaonis]|uniref:DNAI1 n=1 Tax=Acanthosepion pharaonis TaxID=158019 RepID=A0A812D5H7_ACAPH|nr:DNAI1 [Sepia pharaonis]
MLTVSNENEKRNLIRYNFLQCEYKPITVFDPLTVLIEGSIFQNHSDESQFASDATDSMGTGDEEGIEKKFAEREPKLVKNQFNYSDRASQTVDIRPRYQLMQTEPPATATFSASCSQGIIYDAYANEFKEKVHKEPCPTILHPNVNKLAVVMERMIIQNLYDHLLQDFKYYEDPADDVRGNIGCLLPLWKFTSEITKYLSVTSLCWSPRYSDLFAVSFGSFSFNRQGEGIILMYSLKNPSHPIYSFVTECGVMTLDINPVYSNYMCAGFYDGSVAVYNLCKHTGEPEHRSERNVHNMYVAQIQWDKEVTEEQLCCNSVSPDGQVVKWILAPTGLKPHILVTLDISDFIEKSMVEMQIMTFGSGITLDFHDTNNQIYLLGTEMGHAYVCSRVHSTESLQTFDAHYSSVYKIAWNRFHPKIFITCSEDWTVKIWENEGTIRKPLLVFDLGSQVYDVQWAPFSSTVFAAVTAKGQVYVYDLAIDKSEPLCVQVVIFLKKTRLMHLAFNPSHPVILVGDDRGDVTCLKLSPNLRKGPKERKGQVPTDKKSKEKLEKSRLDEVLATVREKCG